MARFRVGRPITTAEPVIVVDAGLEPGRHLFRLVVVTDDGRVSRPDQGTVTVIATRPGPITHEPVNPG